MRNFDGVDHLLQIAGVDLPLEQSRPLVVHFQKVAGVALIREVENALDKCLKLFRGRQTIGWEGVICALEESRYDALESHAKLQLQMLKTAVRSGNRQDGG